MTSMENYVSHNATQGYPFTWGGVIQGTASFWKRGVEVDKKEALTEPWVTNLRGRGPRCDEFKIGMLVRGD